MAYRIAPYLVVASIEKPNSSDEFPFSSLIGPVFHPQTTFGRHQFLENFNNHSSARHLCLCVQLGSSDSITTFGLRFAASKQDMCTPNCLFAEKQVSSSSTHLYTPFVTENILLTYPGQSTSALIPVLIQDNVLTKRIS